jgi:microcystin-dependent protein
VSDQFVAEIRIYPFNFPPAGWAFCNGQLLPISQNTALFSLLGTTYGGDGKSTFGLPDLQGAAPMQPDDNEYYLGQAAGSDTVTVIPSEMPSHSHLMRCATQDSADVGIINPQAAFAQATGGSPYQPAANTNASLAWQALHPMGGSLSHSNLMPYLTLNFCIALQGIFPQRP